MQPTGFTDQFSLEHEFKKALLGHGLALNYQPIVDLTGGHVVGFEALMRWNHEQRGPIPPNVFIPVAAQTGLINDASRWALKEACRALKRIESHVGQNKSLYMSVNFSASDFTDDAFLDYLYETISASDVLPTQIQLELTEELLMSHPETARKSLSFCRQAGMRIAIDDFGTGAAEIKFLQDFPIDTIKLDRSFVRGLLTDKTKWEEAKPVLCISQRRHLTMTAEGIEDADEAHFVKELGCDTAQGYYFARPMPEKEIMQLLLTDHIYSKKLETV